MWDALRMLVWLWRHADELLTVLERELEELSDGGGDLGGKWAHLQWFCRHGGWIRVFRVGQRYWEPYEYSVGFRVHRRFWWPRDGYKGFVELVGAEGAPTLSQGRAIRRAVHQAGWRPLITRVKQQRTRTREIR